MDKISLLESVLGNSIKANRDYHQFKCPFCNHYKHKLGISINSGKWKCWVCNTKGASVFNLFTKLNVDTTRLNNVKILWKETVKYVPSENTKQITLPNNYKPLWIRNDDLQYKQALRYIISRGVTANDIIKHKIGYCDSGSYNGYLVFPNYDEFNQLNYFYCRAYDNTKSSHKIPKDIEKNIICDEQSINWNEDLVLCESKLNAITIKRNVVCMYGKIPSKRLKEKIIKSSLENIYMCLDGDADSEVHEIANYFIENGKNVYHCKIPDDLDANDLGHEKIWEYINNSIQIKQNSIFKNKLLSKLK